MKLLGRNTIQVAIPTETQGHAIKETQRDVTTNQQMIIISQK